MIVRSQVPGPGGGFFHQHMEACSWSVFGQHGAHCWAEETVNSNPAARTRYAQTLDICASVAVFVGNCFAPGLAREDCIA
jgi:hypothetical protein